ncbi:peptide chain release factor N(5)-glutamine methyltransferase [uncultured Treponema sp.]|uniref:peptide chain release factor N(5)-glutamine methyltransferase n=1 Tax=uncultured Treponema sp. TaxID=162155 RepID=UPI0025FC7441|nr:peptide chain release factor N(5)-glutamine methyltransferase [uncultured Treponema sp.]
MTISQARKFALSELKSSLSPLLDADVILKWILKCDQTFILFHSETELSEPQKLLFCSSIEKRKTGLPVAYITGAKEFFGYNFEVDQNVLIPKPDTELLVENAVNFIEEKFHASSDCKILSVCDMCSGSGCVGVSILKFIEEKKIIPKQLLPKIIFADISKKTLDVAKKNSLRLLSKCAFEKTVFVQSNLFENLGCSRNGLFDVIVSNPPYIPYSQTVELLKDGRCEPSLALCGDIDLNGNLTNLDDGLEIIRNLIFQSVDFLNPGGILILETGEYNALQTKKIMENSKFKDVKIYKDLEGQFRNVSGFLA